MRLAAAVALVAVIASPARAQNNDAEERARAHYEIGVGLYRLGDWHGALKEFAAGYELARKPGFLLNLGQTYRKLGELRSARDMYRQFLVESRANDPARPEARRIVAELEQAIAAEPTTPPASPPSPQATEPPQATGPPQAAAPPQATAPPQVTAPPPATAASKPQIVARAPNRLRRAERTSGIVVGSCGLVLVGLGIGYGVVADQTARDLNRIDAAGGMFDPNRDASYSLDRKLEAAWLSVGGAFVLTGAILLIVSAR